MLKIAVIGYGYWGPNLVRNFVELPGVKVVAVADLDRRKLDLITARYPSIRTTTAMFCATLGSMLSQSQPRSTRISKLRSPR
jgi:predicted dehydrogenase